jgi:hypothetical protein
MSEATSAYTSDALTGEVVDTRPCRPRRRTDLAAQVGASAAAGALAAFHISALLATADTDAALAAAQGTTA